MSIDRERRMSEEDRDLARRLAEQMRPQPREHRLGPEDVDAYVRAHDREIRANLAAELDDTVERLRQRGPAPVWSGTSASLREDLQRAVELASRQHYEPVLPPLVLTQEELDRARAHAAQVQPWLTSLPHLYGRAVLPAATPAGPRGDVLEEIDDVLDDWHGSPDAMVWHPEGVHPLPIGPRPGPRPAPVLTPEQLERLTAAATSIGEHLQRFVMTAAEAVQQIVENLRELGYTVTPPAPDADPVDPREHALAMRRRRNTGPPVPPPGARGRRMSR